MKKKTSKSMPKRGKLSKGAAARIMAKVNGMGK